jgi:hypothetical protein
LALLWRQSTLIMENTGDGLAFTGPAGCSHAFVDGLLTDAKEERDLGPRPAVRACVVHLQRLKTLSQFAQRTRRA